jgi:hypothetical protein
LRGRRNEQKVKVAILTSRVVCVDPFCFFYVYVDDIFLVQIINVISLR